MIGFLACAACDAQVARAQTGSAAAQPAATTAAVVVKQGAPSKTVRVTDIRNTKDLKVQTKSTGGSSVKLDGQYHSALFATVGPDGKVITSCRPIAVTYEEAKQ